MNMSKFFSPSQLRSAATHVMKRCIIHGVEISESATIFMLRLLSYDPQWEDICSPDEDYETTLKILSEVCAKKLIEKNNPSIMTLSMQVYFDLNYRSAAQFLQEHEKKSCKISHKVLLKILNSICNTEEDYEMLYSDIVTFVMIRGDMDYQSDETTFEEIKRCVASVLPLSEISSFLHLSKKNKKSYLLLLSPVALGIYLHSCSQGRGHLDLKSVTRSAVKCASNFTKELHTWICKLEDQITTSRAIFEQYLYTDESRREELGMDLTLLKSYTAFIHQFQYYLKMIQKECRCLFLEVSDLKKNCQTIMDNLTDTLASVTLLIPSLVLPLYNDASQVWKALKRRLLILNFLLGIFKYLKELENKCLDKYSKTQFMSLSEKFKEISDKNLEQKDTIVESCCETELKTSSVQVHNSSMRKDPESTSNDESPRENLLIVSQNLVKNFSDITIELKGFCPWALVHGDGMLIRGNRDLKIVMYFDRCFIFSSSYALNEFIKHPSRYLRLLIEILKKQPHLILLLNLQTVFGLEMCNKEPFEEKFVSPLFVADCSCQTELHPVKSYIDPWYKWNQWDLRRQALKYVDMKNKKTHSTQTVLSHFKRDNSTQIYLPKNQFVQTVKDNCMMTDPSL